MACKKYQTGKTQSDQSKNPNGPYAAMWERPGHLVRRLHQIQVGMFMAECAEFNITPVQFGFLTVLHEADALDQITLSAEVGVDRTTGADVIKRLQRRGLLTRVPSTTDRRAKLVQITDAGRDVVRNMFPAMVKSQERFIEPLTKAEQSTLTKLMTKMIEANDSASRAPTSPQITSQWRRSA